MTHNSAGDLSARYARVRDLTVSLCATLAPEDTAIQSIADVSPTKWHLAHTAWFFEHFVLVPHVPDYRTFNQHFDYLFNSYYNSEGSMHPRPARGLLSRPTLATILAYRRQVDDAMQELIASRERHPKLEFLIVLGLNHEQQHQELLLTDIKHVFSCNPMQPAVMPDLPACPTGTAPELRYLKGRAGVYEAGATGRGFCYDNETPRHRVLLHPHRIANRLVTNGEYRDFIRDGAYRDAALWLSDGWSTITERSWQRPLYWNEDLASEYTLGGVREIDPDAPVAHISYYEADAFARWAGGRLPTEFEWEDHARDKRPDGNLLDSGYLHPVSSTDSSQMFGDVWEWTASPYTAYPGFKPLDGSLGEYNGKFMCNQVSVRGGSCVTSRDHIRATYRSFFYPDARWQFLGLRITKDDHS